MTKTNPWILAARPKTLPAAISPVLLGLAYAWHTNKKLDFETAGITMMCTLLMQIASNYINDYYDGIRGVDTKDRLGPLRVTQAGLLTPAAVKTGFMALLGMAFLLGLHLMAVGGLPIIIIGLSSLFFAWAYTGGPFPLSRHGLGEVAAFIFFGPVAVWGTVWLQQPGVYDLMPIYLGAGPGFISATILAINNLRDRESDAKTNKKTIAVRLSEVGARRFTLTLVAFSLLIPIAFTLKEKSAFYLIPVLAFLMFRNNWFAILQGPIDRSLNERLAMTGKFLLAYCLGLSFALVWQ